MLKQQVVHGGALGRTDPREFSFVTRTCPTWIEDRTRRNERLFHRLIQIIVKLNSTAWDHLYGWLALMFGFCAGKSLVYYSMYTPSESIIAIAQSFDVKLTHVPFRALPEALLARNHACRSMHLSLSQWEELERRMAEAGLWQEVDVLRAHREGG